VRRSEQGAAAQAALHKNGKTENAKAFQHGIAVRFAPVDKLINDSSLTLSFDPNPDNSAFVWHCHIIDHEDNEMMRPYRVIRSD
jgi:FtsP/CotA-like multicopper oxidase with cupredoxin domain